MLDAPSKLLLLLAGNLLADYIFTMTPMNGTLLVHEPDAFLASVLAEQASQKKVTLYLTTSEPKKDSSGWIYVHQNSPQRLIKKVLPKNVSLFVDLSLHRTTNSTGNRIGDCLPSQCKLEETTLFFSNKTAVRPSNSPAPVGDLLKAAWTKTQAMNFEIEVPEMNKVFPLKDVSLHKGTGEPVSIVDWTANTTVSVKLQPVDSQDLFRQDRTYFLVGLSGEVGQSICQWMVGHGARYIVLTSRNPKVSKEWIESLEAVGATVKAMCL
jgi:hybrid polyketide synthase/nonribosomal peptide synthetase ACE1